MSIFQLRNKDKLCEAFGEDFFYLLLRSLARYFTSHDEIEEYFDHKNGYPVIKLTSIDKNKKEYFEFFVLERRSFIYFLAYKSN